MITPIVLVALLALVAASLGLYLVRPSRSLSVVVATLALVPTLPLVPLTLEVAGDLLAGGDLKAPLEEPASSTKTPNPAKSPWYWYDEAIAYYVPVASVMVSGVPLIPIAVLASALAVGVELRRWKQARAEPGEPPGRNVWTIVAAAATIGTLAFIIAFIALARLWPSVGA